MEDPSEVAMYTFKKFDEAVFDTAASSPEVANAHFGPVWARFTTVNRMASNAVSRGTKSATAEELHEQSLERKAAAMSKNYSTYEEYLEHEAAGGRRYLQQDEGAATNDADEVDEARGAALCDAGDGYRLHQLERNQERLREADVDAPHGSSVGRRADNNNNDDGGSAEQVPLPSFYKDAGSPAAADDMDVDALVPNVGSITAHTDGQEIVSDTLVLPLVDPQQWTTAQVIMWIRAVGEEGAMDDSMQQAYEMMRVDGNMLLQKVNPNTMFKTMRRWHMKRRALLAKGVSDPEAVSTIAEEFRTLVTVLHVQETIYLCYPYGRY